ncbi:alkaline phosphatase PafA [Aquimarina sp. W85]|uniref:alkaline phosphatase PafA n=1 Tax=Aquimarina rhodophyticola TaxID=3342246 RepID=UPI00366A58A2
MLRIVFFVVTIFSVGTVYTQTKQSKEDRPKLVVGIVVDQMRYDYLTRFRETFGAGGFNRLINDGFQYKNAHFNYIPTYTGPGHASVYTGTTPFNHGIIANNWYDKKSKTTVYCVEDTLVKAVGSTSTYEQMSPRRLKTTSFTDQNRMHTQMRGKTIGISLKDRGAILPAGHTANAAYWFRGRDEGQWITSSYYMDALPKWVQEFNASKSIKSYLKTWNTLKNIDQYSASGEDDTAFEAGFKGKEKPIFPYELADLAESNGGFDILKATPYGNSLTTDFAIAALKGEGLGLDNDTDVLTISFSSTDYIGHNFGVNSKEVQDAYLRLDKDLERLLAVLDKQVGVNNYTIFLTADHGAVNVPAYLTSLKIPAGYFDIKEFSKTMNNELYERFQVKNLIENVSNGQLFFDYSSMKANEINHSVLQSFTAQRVLEYDQVDKVYTREQMLGGTYEFGVAGLLQKGFHQKRSGDVLFVLNPATIVYSKKGSTHGSGSSYDTHAPLLFFGKGIQKGTSVKKVYITDVAPTISTLLGIEFPNGTTGKVLHEVLK